MHAEPSSPPPRRRTQAERRTATRAKLLDATAECIVEHGCAGATTQLIEQRAGVSRGARVHHFPTKASLLASVVDHLYNGLSDHYDEAFGALGADRPGAERFHTGLRMLWSIYCRPEYVAVLELNMAARTDAELRDRLDQVAERHRGLAMAAAERHFALPPPIAVVLVEAVHTTMMGLLMQRAGVGANEKENQVLDLIEHTVIQHLPEES